MNERAEDLIRTTERKVTRATRGNRSAGRCLNFEKRVHLFGVPVSFLMVLTLRAIIDKLYNTAKNYMYNKRAAFRVRTKFAWEIIFILYNDFDYIWLNP